MAQHPSRQCCEQPRQPENDEFTTEIFHSEIIDVEEEETDLNSVSETVPGEVLLKINAHRQDSRRKVSEACMEKRQCTASVQDLGLPLSDILRILSRLLSMHELKLVMQLLEEWVSSPLASAAVSITNVQLDTFLRRFVIHCSDGLGARVRREGLQVIDGWCANNLPGKAAAAGGMDACGSSDDNAAKQETPNAASDDNAASSDRELSRKRSKCRSVPAALDDPDGDDSIDVMTTMLKNRREAQRLAQTRKMDDRDQDQQDDLPIFPATLEADVSPNVHKTLSDNSDKSKQTSCTKDDYYDDVEDYLKEGLSSQTLFPPCAPLRMRHDLSEMLDRHVQEMIRKQRPSFSSSRSRESFRSNEEIKRLVEQNLQYELERKQCCRRCVIRPDSVGRVAFDILTVFVLIHDSIVLPFLLAWDPPLSAGIIVGQYFALSFWSTDIIMSFLTGYYQEGEVVMHPRKIVWHYLSTWFVLDMMVTVIDLVNIILESMTDKDAGGHSRVIKLMKVSRMSRIMGIARIMRLFPRLREFGTLSMSTTLNVVAQVLKILLGILWINHISCCIWYGIGRMEGDTGLTWLDDRTGDMTYRDAPIVYQYSTAMHFSMTQMTPGSMQVFPVNTLERIYNVIALIFGLLFGSTLVGQLSTKMIQFSMSRQDQTRRIAKLRQFLRENNIQQQLATRVQRSILDKIRVHTRLATKEVEAIESLSDALRCELRVAAFSPHFLLHPLFMTWMDIDSHVMKDICTDPDALEFRCLEPGSVLVSVHDQATSAYLILKGMCRYTGRGEADESDNTSPCSNVSPRQMLRSLSIDTNNSELELATKSMDSFSSQSSGMAHQILNAGQWLCEVALWMDWTHKGTIDAMFASELLVVNAASILAMLKTHKILAPLTQAWGQAFCKHGSGEGLYLDTGQDHGAIVALLPEDPKMLICNATMAFIEGQMMGWNKFFKLTKQVNLNNLWSEVESGKSTIIIDGSGKLLRTTFVVALRIARPSDKKLFVQLGKRDKGEEQFRIAPTLIGAKMGQGEMPRDVVQGLFRRDLYPLKDTLHITRTGWSVEQKESDSLAVETRYLRTIFHAVMSNLPEDFFRTMPYQSMTRQDSNDSGQGTTYGSDRGSDRYDFSHVEACLLSNGKGKVTICGWVSQFEFDALMRREYHESLRHWIIGWMSLNQYTYEEALSVSE